MEIIEHHTCRYVTGMKVAIEIPLPNTKVFRDWAIINEIDEDLVSLQLSRDTLPEGVTLRVGQVLSITSQSDGNTYACRAYLVSKGYEQDLLLRFTSETTANELREFYRVDAFLPIRFYILNDQNPANVKEQWETQRKLRRDQEEARERSLLEAKRKKLRSEERVRAREIEDEDFFGETAELPQDRPEEEQQADQYYATWGAVTTLAVTISGGGLRVFTEQQFYADELVILEAYVPTTRKIIDIVARVVSANNSAITEDGKNIICAAMQFIFIDESARSAINNHISSIQLKRIRQFKGFADVEPITDKAVSAPDKHYAYIDSIDATDKADQQDWIRKSKIRQVILVMFFVCCVALLCFLFYRYSVEHPKSEIQKIFEKGIRIHRGE